jgi:hypothetical protein
VHLVQQYGINTSLYPHRILFVPENPTCPWSGQATQSCVPYSCTVWLNHFASDFTLDSLAHELGRWGAGWCGGGDAANLQHAMPVSLAGL